MLAPRDDELPIMVVTHMIATSHEGVSGMSVRVDETCVRDAHHG